MRLLCSQARILEWVAIFFSRGSSQSRDKAHVSCIGRLIFYRWATREAWRKLWLRTNLETHKLRISNTNISKFVTFIRWVCTHMSIISWKFMQWKITYLTWISEKFKIKRNECPLFNSFSNFSINVYWVPGTVPDTWDVMVTKQDRAFALMNSLPERVEYSY